MLLLRIRNRRLRVAAAVALILAGVAIDLLFSAHPAASIILLVAAVALLTGILVSLGRIGPRRSDRRR